MKNKYSKEVKIGVAFLVSIFLLYYGINFLKGVNIFKPTNSYLVVFEDVTSLTLSTPVLINGFQVGLVHSMNLDEQNRVVTTINLDKGLKVPRGSRLMLDVSMLGNASILIEENPIKTDYYTSTDTILGGRVKGLLDAGATLGPQIGAMIPKLDSLLVSLNVLVTSPAIGKSLENMEVITTNLAKSSAHLNNFMAKDLPGMTRKMEHIASNVEGLTSNLNSIDIASTYSKLDSTMMNVHQLSNKLMEEDNSLGLLLNDRKLYDNLNSTLSNASLLLEDVKENPSKYINIKVF